MGSIKDELVGYCTLAVMALLGMALYSGTYSLIYASIGISEPTVAILEMWMTSLHLFSSVGCCVLQAVYAGVFQKREAALPFLAEAQTGLFLGVACAVTILGNSCLQGGECLAYYGAASFPRLAAAGSIGWVWIMYGGALGCQAWERGVSLGFSDKEGLTAAAVMIMLPAVVTERLVTTCGWAADTCGSGGCESIVPMLLVLGGLVICHAGSCIARIAKTGLGRFVRILGYAVVLVAVLFLPAAPLWPAYIITTLVLGGNGVVSELWAVLHFVRRKRKATHQRLPSSAAEGDGSKRFSFADIKHKISSTLSSGKKKIMGSHKNG